MSDSESDNEFGEMPTGAKVAQQWCNGEVRAHHCDREETGTVNPD